MDVFQRAILSGILKDVLGSRRVRIFVAILGALGALAVFINWPDPRRSVLSTSVQPDAPAALSRRDAAGNLWTLDLVDGESMGRIRASGRVPGAPLCVKSTLYPTATGEVLIGLVLVGQAGERYSGAVCKNGQLLPAPTFKVVDKRGRIVGTGTFKYG